MNNHIEIAKRFINEEFSDCQVALLAGSVVRGEATETSDLDIVIITEDERTPFRQSFFKHDWMIETFVFSMESYKTFFEDDFKKRIPSIIQMCQEGVIIKDTNDLSEIIKKDADEWMNKGVTPYSDKEIEAKRYMLTSIIDDLIGCNDFEQQIFIVNQMIEYTCNIILVTNGHWEAKGKWAQKLMKEFDPQIYKEMITALNTFYKSEAKEPLIQFVEKELDKVGGRLFEGYYREARK
ncbi:MAG: nucleotidyltransferase domain-containing protein [Candidatus Delongbacteria bacterium]|nr:nucleotidyltransferase domain-containing protein [Candidatus Delongbacteria bacterium]